MSQAREELNKGEQMHVYSENLFEGEVNGLRERKGQRKEDQKEGQAAYVIDRLEETAYLSYYKQRRHVIQELAVLYPRDSSSRAVLNATIDTSYYFGPKQSLSAGRRRTQPLQLPQTARHYSGRRNSCLMPRTRDTVSLSKTFREGLTRLMIRPRTSQDEMYRRVTRLSSLLVLEEQMRWFQDRKLEPAASPVLLLPPLVFTWL